MEAQREFFLFKTSRDGKNRWYIFFDKRTGSYRWTDLREKADRFFYEEAMDVLEKEIDGEAWFLLPVRSISISDRFSSK